MRRPLPVLLVALLLLPMALGACSDDGGGAGGSTTSPGPSTTEPGGSPQDPGLVSLLVSPGDLPGRFAASADVDDTITAFCAGQDAAAGLQARGRAIAGYTREPPGASVIHLVFRFRAGDASRFVEQATALLDACSDVPDDRGLAFTYEPAAPAIDAALAGTDGHVARAGASVGSGSLTIQLAVFRVGDVGQLVAALGVDMPRSELDALAEAAVSAAVNP